MKLKEAVSDNWQTVCLLIPPAVVTAFEIVEAWYYSVPVDCLSLAWVWIIFGVVAVIVYFMTKEILKIKTV